MKFLQLEGTRRNLDKGNDGGQMQKRHVHVEYMLNPGKRSP